MEMSIVLKVFSHTPKQWTNWSFDLMLLDEWIHPEERYEYLYQIPWQSIQKLSRFFTKNQKCQPHGGAKGKVRRSFLIHWIWSIQKLEIFQSGPKRWTDWLTKKKACTRDTEHSGLTAAWIWHKNHSAKSKKTSLLLNPAQLGSLLGTSACPHFTRAKTID